MTRLFAQYIHPGYGHEHQQATAQKLLAPGVLYEVERLSMGQSSTTIFLKGFDVAFNSVMFEFFEPVNIYRDARFNPYMEVGNAVHKQN